jgi:hypothetical protein
MAVGRLVIQLLTSDSRQPIAFADSLSGLGKAPAPAWRNTVDRPNPVRLQTSGKRTILSSILLSDCAKFGATMPFKSPWDL